MLDRKLKRLASILETIEGIQPINDVCLQQESVWITKVIVDETWGTNNLRFYDY
jgi:hypothetical protein